MKTCSLSNRRNCVALLWCCLCAYLLRHLLLSPFAVCHRLHSCLTHTCPHPIACVFSEPFHRCTVINPVHVRVVAWHQPPVSLVACPISACRWPTQQCCTQQGRIYIYHPTPHHCELEAPTSCQPVCYQLVFFVGGERSGGVYEQEK